MWVWCRFGVAHGVGLMWVWCGFGVGLGWVWCAFGVGLEWFWCGLDVGLVWVWPPPPTPDLDSILHNFLGPSSKCELSGLPQSISFGKGTGLVGRCGA